MEKIKKSLKCFSEEEPCVTNKLESFVHVVFLGTFFFLSSSFVTIVFALDITCCGIQPARAEVISEHGDKVRASKM